MYTLNEQQIDFILNDIKLRGVEMEDLQLNLLDHVCCIIEQKLEANGDFEHFYATAIKRFYNNDLAEIQEETILLLTFKYYYTMKKIMILSGVIAVASFTIGAFFKLMFWPGALALILAGLSVASFLFLPLLFILKLKDSTVKRDKIITGLGTVTGMLFCTGFLFMFLHLPGAHALWLSSVAMSFFVFIPVYFFTGIRNAEIKMNTILTSVILMIATVLQFSAINLRPVSQESKSFTFIQNELLLKQLRNNIENDISSVGINNSVLTDEINNSCEQIKALLLEQAIGQTSLPADFDAKKMVIEESGTGNDFLKQGKGYQLLIELKNKVNSYNNSLHSNEKNKVIPVENSILDIDPDKLTSYSNIFVLTNISQLQLQLVYATHQVNPDLHKENYDQRLLHEQPLSK